MLIPASIVVTGPNSYVDFVKHTLTVHNNTPLTNHMGLQTILVHDWDGRMRFTRDDNLDDPFQGWKQGRLDRHKKLRWLHTLLIVGLFGWTIWALRRTKLLWIGQALAAPIVMAMTNLTCYYYSMYLLCAALAMARWQLGPVVLLASGASQILLLNYYWVDDKFTAQAWLFWIFGLVLLYGYSRPFSMERPESVVGRQTRAEASRSPSFPGARGIAHRFQRAARRSFSSAGGPSSTVACPPRAKARPRRASRRPSCAAHWPAPWRKRPRAIASSQ